MNLGDESKFASVICFFLFFHKAYIHTAQYVTPFSTYLHAKLVGTLLILFYLKFTCLDHYSSFQNIMKCLLLRKEISNYFKWVLEKFQTEVLWLLNISALMILAAISNAKIPELIKKLNKALNLPKVSFWTLVKSWSSKASHSATF